MEIHESNPAGKRTATFIVSKTDPDMKPSVNLDGGKVTVAVAKWKERVDILPSKRVKDLLARQPFSVYPYVWSVLLDVFLPVGYPASVTDDYLPYQIYDSLQAFSSSIAGLLSSRAVLEGVGVGSSSASPTSALLLHILQDSTGRISTILFAHRFGAAIEPECKRFRLLADVLNDCGMLLDCASPLLPRGGLRWGAMCAGGVLRALCGVAGGASKGVLSMHFARKEGGGGVGELNAKDASQETVISLIGMLAGSLVVSYVVSQHGTWACLIVLLTVHLSMNHAAVRAVKMNTLNRQRACLTFSHIFETGKALTPGEVAARECIFERGSLLRWNGVQLGVRAKVGVSIREILSALVTSQQRKQFADLQHASLAEIIELFAAEKYLLWYDRQQGMVLIAFKDSITTKSQLQAWAHALLIALALQRREKSNLEAKQMAIIEVLKSTLEDLKTRWDKDAADLTAAGWDLDTASLETISGTRVELAAGTRVE